MINRVAGYNGDKACAVQILLVALSRRICCSLVCNAMRRAVLPYRSLDTMMRPGIDRLNPSVHAKKAACGPP